MIARVVRMLSVLVTAIVLATTLTISNAVPAKASVQALNCDPIRQARVIRAQSNGGNFFDYWSNVVGTNVHMKAELWQAKDIYDGNWCRAIWAKGLFKVDRFFGYCPFDGGPNPWSVTIQLRSFPGNAVLVTQNPLINQCDVIYGIFASNLPWTVNGTFKGWAHFGPPNNPNTYIQKTGEYTMSA